MIKFSELVYPGEGISGIAVFNQILRYGIMVSRMTRERESDFHFIASVFRRALREDLFVTDMEIRSYGTRMPRERLRSLKLRTNVILTEEFFDCLTMEARQGPIEAAGTIARSVNAGLFTRRDVASYARNLGEDWPVVLVPSVAAYGPCEVAASSAAQYSSIEAPTLPLRHCTWPGQCACRYSIAKE